MIHCYELLGRYILLDVESGAVHRIDEATYRLLQKPNHSPETEEEREIYEELCSLRAAELLDAPESDIPVQASGPVKALCLHVSHDCNLRCGYCFAGTGNFGGTRCNMPPEIGHQAIDFLLAHSGSRRNLEIDFFGGEPLLAFETVRQTVEYARSRELETGKKFRFTLTTNGVLLDEEIIDYLNENMDNIVLSVDGKPETNDALRKTIDGKGSYHGIVPSYRKLLAKRGKKPYFVRGTFTRRNPDFVGDLLHLAEAGFESLSLEPVVLTPGHPLAITEAELPIIKTAYEHLAEIMLERSDFGFFHFQVDLAQGPCVYKRLRGCGAGVEYAAVTPDGELYPCHQFVGKEEYRLGSLLKGIVRTDISERFGAMNIRTRSACHDCWAKYYCSGGCAASNLTTMGSLETPDAVGCTLERKRLECAILLKTEELTLGNQGDGVMSGQ